MKFFYCNLINIALNTNQYITKPKLCQLILKVVISSYKRLFIHIIFINTYLIMSFFQIKHSKLHNLTKLI